MQRMTRRRAALVMAVTALAVPSVGMVDAGAPLATTTATYDGDVMVVAGLGAATLGVTVASSDPACVAERTVRFRIDINKDGKFDPNEYWVSFSLTTGAAKAVVRGLAAGAYQVVAEVEATSRCSKAAAAVDLFVAEPGSQASGSGWYEYPSIGRAHLEFSARTRVHPSEMGLPPTATARGNVSWRIDRLAKFNGTVTGYTTWCPPQSNTTLGARCGLVGGTGTLWLWGTVGKKAGWVKQSDPLEFRLLVEDGNPLDGKGRACTIVGPDRVRMYLPGFEFLSKTAGLLPLDKGRIDVT
jgi:hypothetical protein